LIGPDTAAWADGFLGSSRRVRPARIAGSGQPHEGAPVAAIEQAAATAKRRGVWRLRDLRGLLTEGDTLVQVDFRETHPLIRPLAVYSLEALS
jgi:hypothetical protein